MSILQVNNEIYTLVDGSYTLSIDPQKGGHAFSFKNGNDEYLHSGISILFPNDKSTFVSTLPWNVYRAGNESIILTLNDNETTKETFSSSFLLVLRYTLLDNKATVSLTIKNNTKDVIPYNVGFYVDLLMQEISSFGYENEKVLSIKDKNKTVTFEFNKAFINTIEKETFNACASIKLWDVSKGNNQKELLDPEEEKTFTIRITIS